MDITILLSFSVVCSSILNSFTKSLMVPPCRKTVKKTMTRAAVTKSSLYHHSAPSLGRTTAREKPTAPLRPPYAMMNCSFSSILSMRPRLTRNPNRKTLMNLKIKQRKMVAMMKPGCQ